MPKIKQGLGYGQKFYETPFWNVRKDKGNPPPWRLCRNSLIGGRCHAELVSASNKIKNLRDPEINSG